MAVRQWWFATPETAAYWSAVLQDVLRDELGGALSRISERYALRGVDDEVVGESYDDDDSPWGFWVSSTSPSGVSLKLGVEFASYRDGDETPDRVLELGIAIPFRRRDEPQSQRDEVARALEATTALIGANDFVASDFPNEVPVASGLVFWHRPVDDFMDDEAWVAVRTRLGSADGSSAVRQAVAEVSLRIDELLHLADVALGVLEPRTRSVSATLSGWCAEVIAVGYARRRGEKVEVPPSWYSSYDFRVVGGALVEVKSVRAKRGGTAHFSATELDVALRERSDVVLVWLKSKAWEPVKRCIGGADPAGDDVGSPVGVDAEVAELSRALVDRLLTAPGVKFDDEGYDALVHLAAERLVEPEQFVHDCVWVREPFDGAADGLRWLVRRGAGLEIPMVGLQGRRAV